MKKILVTASTASHLVNFHLPYLQKLKERGYTIHAAIPSCMDIPYTDKTIYVPYHRKLFSFQNIKALIKMRAQFKERYELVVMHTPLAATVARGAVCLTFHKPTVLCFAHGYMFDRPYSFMQLFYLLVEKLLAGSTDYLVIMNREDEWQAEKYRLFRKKMFYINGMGVPAQNFAPVQSEQKKELRRLYEISPQTLVFIYAAEFIKKKNQKMLIEAFSKLDHSSVDTRLFLAGDGVLLEQCKALAESLDMENKIIFTGYSDKVGELLKISDVVVSPSKREGLPFHIVEAMACGLPVVASRVKGHVELVDEGVNGKLFSVGDESALQNSISWMLAHQSDLPRMGAQSREKSRFYMLGHVFDSVMQIYKEALIHDSGGGKE